MRTMFWCSLLSAALAAGACKKSSPTDTGQAGKEVKKSQEKVQEERKDLEKEKETAPDRTKEEKAAPAEPSRTPTSEETKGEESERAKKRADLEAAQADLQAAHEKFSITVRDRIKKVDIRLRELEQRGDAKSRAEFSRLRARRDEIATEANQAKTTTPSDWDSFQKDVDGKLGSLDKDVDDALSAKPEPKSDTNK